ncbi:MAG: hypothetical protein HWN68_11310 [Desulfobacterales bacterium]|nr:hypothetical protein [Desulfobacterales bacterium]
MKDKLIKHKTQLSRRDEPSLRIAGVQFTPTAGIERRLTRVFELLLGPATGKSHAATEDEAISGEESED